jgi:hypothetical protein
MLALRSLFFAIVVPGTVAVLIPYLIVSRGSAGIARPWTPLHFLSLVLMIVGAAVLVRCIWDFAAKGRGTLVNLFVVLYEEPSLRHRFGESYERYLRSVHRWLPTRPAGRAV